MEQLESGLPFKAVFERLLREATQVQAAEMMQLFRESRGAWFGFLEGPPKRALFVGNALSGTPWALAAGGWQVTLLDVCASRAALARHRALAQSGAHWNVLCGGDRPKLPFEDGSFALLVLEDGWPEAGGVRATKWGFDAREAARVTSGEVALVAQNRLAYKRSYVRHGEFAVLRPAEWLRQVLGGGGNRSTLAGWRKRLAAWNAARVTSYSLYPHSDDYSHVVALDAPLPKLSIGRKERGNWLKVAAKSAGLFPVLTPSYLLTSHRGVRGPHHFQRLLEALASKLKEPTPRLEHLVATRGNTAVLLTCASPGAPRGSGRWCVHVPLSPSQHNQTQVHERTLRLLRRERPELPVPEPYFCGELEGMFACLEARADGLPAPQLTGELQATARMLADVSAQLLQLAFEAPRPWSAADFEELVGARMDLASAFAHVESTRVAIAALRQRLRQVCVGKSIPIVLHHQDLRSKHLQVRKDGSVLAYLDWGTAQERGLVLFDLLHLIVHERKQERDMFPGDAWKLVRDRTHLRPYERQAVERYCAELSIDDDVRSAMEAAYPVFVAAMAEANWDYSRPQWLHRQFGL